MWPRHIQWIKVGLGTVRPYVSFPATIKPLPASSEMAGHPVGGVPRPPHNVPPRAESDPGCRTVRQVRAHQRPRGVAWAPRSPPGLWRSPTRRPGPSPLHGPPGGRRHGSPMAPPPFPEYWGSGLHPGTRAPNARPHALRRRPTVAHQFWRGLPPLQSCVFQHPSMALICTSLDL